MVRVPSIALVLMMPALALAQPRIPTGDADKQPAPEASRAPAYGIEQPLFAPERMARDASPEHVKMMNSLSFASAVPVAVADAARIVADREAQRLVAAVWVSLLREYKVLKGEPYPDKTPAAFVRKDVFEILSRAKGGEGAQVHEGYAFLRWVVDTYGAPYQVYVPHPELSPETDIDVVEPGREAIEQMVNAAFEKAQQGVLQQGGLMEAIQRQQGGGR